ncbi:MAG: hypothetical protein H0W84_01590, partial [Bacteroidetes bacterium]|nr:hypothetical protein [Bacteroidota bacterium]
MKKKLLLFSSKCLVLFIVLISINIKNIQAQGTCGTATNIASLPYAITGLTNCGKGANYSGTPACLTSTNFAGEDYVFKFTPTVTGCVNALVIFDASSSPWNSGFALLDRCPTAAGAVCVGTAAGTLGTTTLSLLKMNLTAGTTYYFVVSGGQSIFNSPPNECFGFDFKLAACPIPPPPLPTTPQGIECGSNLGMEDGNLNGWTGYTGVNTQTPATVGIVPGVASVNGALGTCTSNPAAGVGTRHTRTTGTGFDPNTDNVVSVVAPGCRVSSLRIGNQEAGYQAEAMEKTFMVTTSNVLFTYLYAVVLQNPAGHTTSNQPRFDISIKTSGGALISCGGVYEVTADNALSEGFTRADNPPCGSPDVWYKNWTAVGTDLTPYIGQSVTIRFTTVDCTQGGHFGYAYVDTYCKPKEIFGTKVCTLGSSVTLTAPQGFTDYVWSPGGATGQSVIINNPVDGAIYTVSFKSIVGASCISTVTDTIKLITATVTGDTTICIGATGVKKFIATSTDASATYSWTSTPAGFTSSSPTPSVTLPSVTTVYKVIVSSPLGCTLTKSVTITVNPPPTITVNSPTICPGLTTTLTASGGATYLWSTMATTTAITVSPASTASYTVTGTNTFGCTASAVATVTVSPPCGVNLITTPATVCNGNCGTVTASANSGVPPYAFVWSIGGATTTSVSACPTSTTSYTVTVTDNATNSATAIAVITVNPNPVVSVANANYCTGGSAVLTATGADTYTWSPATGLTPSTGSPVTANPSITTTYTVTGTIAATGCTGTTTVVVTVNPNPTITVPGASICVGGSTPLTASGADSYTWTPAATLSSSAGPTVTATPTVTTTYTITGTT